MRELVKAMLLAAAVGVFAAMDAFHAAPVFDQAPATAVRAVAAPCESLLSLSLPHTTITLAQHVSGGTFMPPETTAGGPPNRGLENLPSFCRVTATLQPSTDSDIKIELADPALENLLVGGAFKTDQIEAIFAAASTCSRGASVLPYAML